LLILKNEIIKTYHQELGHPSNAKLLIAIRKRFNWNGIWSDIVHYKNNCITCIKYNPLDAVAIDTIFWNHKGRSNSILVMTDYNSRYLWCNIIPDNSSRSAINILSECFKNGVPKLIVTDAGTQFCSQEFKAFCESLNIDLHNVSPENHQGNGLLNLFLNRLESPITLLPIEQLDNPLMKGSIIQFTAPKSRDTQKR
jgi:hypothetical protein